MPLSIPVPIRDHTKLQNIGTLTHAQLELYLSGLFYYGVSWNESTDTYVRTGSTAGYACGITLSDWLLPVQRMMRGCLLKDDGTVNYYLYPTDWAYKADGVT
ncbi:MAG: hypothetical protein ABIJ08_05305, partial [Nanoarchaeota archaeon]